MAIASRVMQWGVFTEENKRINLCIQSVTSYYYHKKNKNEGQLLIVLCLHISVALQQKTANF